MNNLAQNLAQVFTDAIAGVRQQLREKVAERNYINIQITAFTRTLADFQQARNIVNGRDFPLGRLTQANANIANTTNGWNTELASLRADLTRVNQEIAGLRARIAEYAPQAVIAVAPPAANGGGPAPVLGRRAAPEAQGETPARRTRWS